MFCLIMRYFSYRLSLKWHFYLFTTTMRGDADDSQTCKELSTCLPLTLASKIWQGKKLVKETPFRCITGYYISLVGPCLYIENSMQCIWHALFKIKTFLYSNMQDLKNQILTTNVWVEHVSKNISYSLLCVKSALPPSSLDVLHLLRSSNTLLLSAVGQSREVRWPISLA